MMTLRPTASPRRSASASTTIPKSSRGDLLPHDCYEAWAEEPRERLRLLYLRMLRLAGRWHDFVNTDPPDEYGAVLEALTTLCRNHPTLSVGAAPIAVVVMRPTSVTARAS